MERLKNKTVVVAGGTGNVGSFIVRGLLLSGATVVVPSRSEEKIEKFKSHLQSNNDIDLNRLVTLQGNIGEEKTSKEVLADITKTTGNPDGVVSTLGRFIPAPSLLTADLKDLRTVLDHYLFAHFVVARTFLPLFKENGGSFVFINGPLALKPWDGSGFVSIATAGQQMLFKSLAKELENSGATVAELMTYAYIRNRQTQSGSTVQGEHVGALASWMMSDSASNIHGETIHLKSPDVLKELGIDTAE